MAHRGSQSFRFAQLVLSSLLEKLRLTYQLLLASLVVDAPHPVSWESVSRLSSWFAGSADFFPATDSGQLRYTCAPRPARIEETAPVRPGGGLHPPGNSALELENVLDNIGLPYSYINFIYNRSA
jgi:hypothetical protein